MTLDISETTTLYMCFYRFIICRKSWHLVLYYSSHCVSRQHDSILERLRFQLGRVAFCSWSETSYKVVTFVQSYISNWWVDAAYLTKSYTDSSDYRIKTWHIVCILYKFNYLWTGNWIACILPFRRKTSHKLWQHRREG